MGMNVDMKRAIKVNGSSGKYIPINRDAYNAIDLRRISRTHQHPCLPVRLGNGHPTWPTRSLTRRNGRCHHTTTRPRHSLILLTRRHGRIPTPTWTVKSRGARGSSCGCGRSVWIER